MGSATEGRVIAVLNHKGGVGKTVLSTEIPILLARQGKRVLLVDLDPQTNLTLNMGFNQSPETTPGKAIARSIFEPHMQPLDEVVIPVDGIDGLYIAPGSTSLEEVAKQLTTADAADHRLADLLEDLAEKGEHFDLVIIDCPPGLGVLSTNALIAATEVMVPVDLRNTNSLVGVSRLAEKIGALRKRAPKDGIYLVGNMYAKAGGESRTDEQRNLDMLGQLGYPVASAVIPYRKAIFKAHNRHQPLARQSGGLSAGGNKAIQDLTALANTIADGQLQGHLSDQARAA